jgi:hypothetical protein
MSFFPSSPPAHRSQPAPAPSSALAGSPERQRFGAGGDSWHRRARRCFHDTATPVGKVLSPSGSQASYEIISVTVFDGGDANGNVIPLRSPIGVLLGLDAEQFAIAADQNSTRCCRLTHEPLIVRRRTGRSISRFLSRSFSPAVLRERSEPFIRFVMVSLG